MATKTKIPNNLKVSLTLEVDLDPDKVSELLEQGYTEEIILDLLKGDLKAMTIPRFPNSPMVDVWFNDVQVEERK